MNKNVLGWLGLKDKNRTLTTFMVEGHITTSHANVIIEIFYHCSTKLIIINYTCERRPWHKVVPFLNIYPQDVDGRG